MQHKIFAHSVYQKIFFKAAIREYFNLFSDNLLNEKIRKKCFCVSHFTVVLTRAANVISADPELVRVILHVLLVLRNLIVDQFVGDFVFISFDLKFQVIKFNYFQPLLKFLRSAAGSKGKSHGRFLKLRSKVGTDVAERNSQLLCQPCIRTSTCSSFAPTSKSFHRQS